MEFQLDKTMYHKTALLKAAYKFLDRVYVHLSQSDCHWIISWSNKPGNIVEPQELENELIEQELRYQLIAESSELRKILLARAMASTIIEKKPDEETPMISVDEDPGILESWYTNGQNTNI